MQKVTSLGDVLELLDKGEAARAWLLVQEATQAAVRFPSLRQRLSTSDADDLAQEALLRAFDRRAEALRRAPRDTPLEAWLSGTMKNLAREGQRRERALRLLPFQKDGAHGTLPVAQGAPQGWEGIDLSRLTQRQRVAIDLRLQGWSIRAISRQLGITWPSARDIVQRAVARLRAPASKPPLLHQWARSVARDDRTALPAHRQALLDNLARGESIAALAKAHGVSRECMRGRVRRLRFRLCSQSLG